MNSKIETIIRGYLARGYEEGASGWDWHHLAADVANGLGLGQSDLAASEARKLLAATFPTRTLTGPGATKGKEAWTARAKENASGWSSADLAKIEGLVVTSYTLNKPAITVDAEEFKAYQAYKAAEAEKAIKAKEAEAKQAPAPAKSGK